VSSLPRGAYLRLLALVCHGDCLRLLEGRSALFPDSVLQLLGFRYPFRGSVKEDTVEQCRDNDAQGTGTGRQGIPDSAFNFRLTGGDGGGMLQNGLKFQGHQGFSKKMRVDSDDVSVP
jgi:hypothetical protein